MDVQLVITQLIALLALRITVSKMITFVILTVQFASLRIIVRILVIHVFMNVMSA